MPRHSVDDAEVEELEKLFSKKATAAVGVGEGRRSTLTPGTVGLTGGGGGDGGGGNASGSAGRARRGGGSVVGMGVSGRVKKISLLDVNRGNNVAIGLKAFRRVGDVSELAGLVGGLDPKGVLGCLLYCMERTAVRSAMDHTAVPYLVPPLVHG